MTNTKSILSEALEVSKVEFKESIDPKLLLEAPTNDFIDGVYLRKIAPNTEACIALRKEAGIMLDLEAIEENDGIKQGVYGKCFRPLFNGVTDEIITLSAGTLKELLAIIVDIHNEYESTFYGALVTVNGTTYNPFHVLNALLIVEQDSEATHTTMYLPAKATIYMYKSEETYKELELKYGSYLCNPEQIEQSINNLIMVGCERIPTEVKIEKPKNDEQSADTVKVSYRIKKQEGENPDSECLLVATQMLTQGLVIPYYSSSLIEMNGSTKGLGVSPMRSSNIQHPGGFMHYLERAKKQEVGIQYSVCTGSLNNRTLKGLRSLQHSNTLSPYNSNPIQLGSLEYARLSVIKSIELLHLAEIVDKPPVRTFYDTCVTNIIKEQSNDHKNNRQEESKELGDPPF